MANVIKLKRGSGSDPTANDLVVGEVAVRTDTGKLFTKKDNGTIAEISGAGGSDIFINTLSSSSGSGGGSATFNGTATRFTLSNPPDVSAQQLLVSVNGVIQKPNAGTSPSTGFAVDGNDIIFAAAPETGASFFIVTYGTIGLGIPADNSVTTGKIADGTIVNADVNASAAIAGSKINPNFGSQDISTTGNLTLYGTNPTISFTDSNEDSDFRLFINAGKFKIQDASNSNADRFTVFTDGHIDIPGNLNCADGLDVTGEITSTSHLDMPDDAKIKLGTGDDLQLYHSGTQSIISNSTGSFIIENTSSTAVLSLKVHSNNRALVARPEGATELYYDDSLKFQTTANGIELPGSNSLFLGGKIDMPDNSSGNNGKILLGTGDDLEIYHNGTNSYLDNSTGITYIRNTGANGSQIQLLSNNGGIKIQGTTAEQSIIANSNGSVDLYHNNVKKFETSSSGVSVTGNIVVSGTVDGVDIAAFNTAVSGLSSGSAVLTNGVTATTQGASDNTTKVATTAYVTTAISNLINGAPSALDTLNELAAAMNDDAAFSATVTNSLATKMPLAGGTFTGDVTFDGATSGRDIIFDRSDNSLGFADNTKIRIGNSQDLEIYHDGSKSIINDSGTGHLEINTNDLRIQNAAANETLAQFIQDSFVALYHNNTKMFETASYGANFTSNVRLGSDSNSLQIGASQDLKLFHDGTHSKITNTTGTLVLQSNAFSITNFAGNSNRITANSSGAVFLYHNDSAKLETTSSGVSVTGNFGMSGAFNGNLVPDSDSSRNLGANGTRWANVYADTLYGDGSNLTGIGADLVNDSSPQLGGTLDANGNNIEIDDGNFLKFGGTGLTIRTNANNAYITEGTSGKLLISASNLELANADSSKTYAYFTNGGSAQLYHNNSSKLETATYGLNLKDQLIQDCYSINSGGNQFRMIVPTGTSGGFRVLAHYADGSAAFNDSIANFYTTGIEFTKDITAARDINPYANNAYDLGNSSYRWRNVYTNDLNLSNEGGANDVDGTWGSYTIQEGDESLFLINKRNGKKYKFNLTEVS